MRCCLGGIEGMPRGAQWHGDNLGRGFLLGVMQGHTPPTFTHALTLQEPIHHLPLHLIPTLALRTTLRPRPAPCACSPPPALGVVRTHELAMCDHTIEVVVPRAEHALHTKGSLRPRLGSIQVRPWPCIGTLSRGGPRPDPASPAGLPQTGCTPGRRRRCGSRSCPPGM